MMHATRKLPPSTPTAAAAEFARQSAALPKNSFQLSNGKLWNVSI
jgi:hypothetical protein